VTLAPTPAAPYGRGERLPDANEPPVPETVRDTGLTEEFIVDRDPNRHLGFGMGIHYCLGAPLARLEGQIAMRTLIPRINRVEIVDEGEGGALRPGGPDYLKVRFELDAAAALA